MIIEWLTEHGERILCYAFLGFLAVHVVINFDAFRREAALRAAEEVKSAADMYVPVFEWAMLKIIALHKFLEREARS